MVASSRACRLRTSRADGISKARPRLAWLRGGAPPRRRRPGRSAVGGRRFAARHPPQSWRGNVPPSGALDHIAGRCKVERIILEVSAIPTTW